MMSSMLSTLPLAVLIACFAAFSVASYRHFNPDRDSRGNLIVRVLTLVATLCSGLLMFVAWPLPGPMALGAAALGLIALALFRAAIRSAPTGELHVAFTGSGPEQLFTQGLYRHIRNPLYTSYLIYWAAWVAATDLHPVSLAIFALFFALYRIAVRDEEQYLRKSFGDQYVAFQKRTGRFLPRLSALLQ